MDDSPHPSLSPQRGEGFSRKKVALVTERCTGCAGAPVCRIFCPSGALEIQEDRENFPFKRMQVNADSCSGCGSCVTRGPQGARILGCPWNAIRLTPVRGF